MVAQASRTKYCVFNLYNPLPPLLESEEGRQTWCEAELVGSVEHHFLGVHHQTSFWEVVDEQLDHHQANPAFQRNHQHLRQLRIYCATAVSVQMLLR
jgi:hypothetical protein